MKQPNIMPAMREWAAESIAPKPKPAPRLDEKPIRTPATPEEIAAIKAIGRVTFGVGTGSKRFARQMQGATELTDRQRGFLWGIVWHFRRQIADKALVEIAEKRMGNQ